ncbi:astacin-like metalloendopeptidase [Pteropus vampyrus]|uniref:Metalloendopeptidase n=1 Tax=Pteropus vampyrus TaxID=132908 RepID=A0A6P3RHD1_PTEVA|nr:astacin-like metalloendopeptidase [Pteropus vampyrus]
MGGLWPWVLGLLSLPGWILGAPPASSCPGACGNSFSGLASEETQTSWDKDIPAINQGLIPEETPESSFLLEGDILRPSPFRLFSATSNKWPKDGDIVEVPFLLSSQYDDPSREVILQAFAEFERFTCIRFVTYHGQRDFISIVPMPGCFSSVGRSGGMQVVSLAPTCLQRGPGIVLHELMHVLGFWHEHARADRDRYIRVNWDEILPAADLLPILLPPRAACRSGSGPQQASGSRGLRASSENGRRVPLGPRDPAPSGASSSFGAGGRNFPRSGEGRGRQRDNLENFSGANSRDAGRWWKRM